MRSNFLAVLIFFLTGSLLASSQIEENDSVNRLTPQILRKTAVKKEVPLALEIYKNGGFRGFQPAPGCSMEGSEKIIDFLIQDIAIDQQGNPINESPLKAERTRNIRVRDKLPYIMNNYPRSNEKPGLPGYRHHRFSVPFPSGFDQNGKHYPIIAGIRDMTPSSHSSEYNTLGVRDLVSMVGVFPNYACYMGAYIPRKGGCAVSVGAGYANPRVGGIARSAHPLFPNPVPRMGMRWYASVLQKTIFTGDKEDSLKKFPGHKANTLAVQFVIGKRLMHAYGNRTSQTKPLDTVVGTLGYNNVNSFGTAPVINNPSAQVELIYITREFGYATRWEMWGTDKDQRKNVIALAQEAYASGHLGPPANLEGKYSEHLEIGPMIEDKELGVYKFIQTITDPETGEKETRTWYLTGGHDYTNVQMVPTPMSPYAFAAPQFINPYYLRFFGIPAKIPQKQNNVSR